MPNTLLDHESTRFWILVICFSRWSRPVAPARYTHGGVWHLGGTSDFEDTKEIPYTDSTCQICMVRLSAHWGFRRRSCQLIRNMSTLSCTMRVKPTCCICQIHSGSWYDSMWCSFLWMGRYAAGPRCSLHIMDFQMTLHFGHFPKLCCTFNQWDSCRVASILDRNPVHLDRSRAQQCFVHSQADS